MRWRTMLAAMLTMAVVCVSEVRADWLEDRRAAAKLVAQGKHDEALAAWQTLAQSAGNDAQKTDALEQAVASASKLKQWDQATQLAKQIPQPAAAMVAQMRILADQNKHGEVVALSEKLDTAGWPDARIGEAMSLRGISHYRLRNGDAAEADLARAMGLLPDGTSRDIAALFRGDNFRDLLKDPEKALSAYQESHTQEQKRDRFGWLYYSGLIRAAEMQRKLTRYDEAQATLDQVDVQTMKNGGWEAQFRMARGDLLIERGQFAEARAMLEPALSIPKISDGIKAAVQKRLDALPK